MPAADPASPPRGESTPAPERPAHEGKTPRNSEIREIAPRREPSSSYRPPPPVSTGAKAPSKPPAPARPSVPPASRGHLRAVPSPTPERLKSVPPVLRAGSGSEAGTTRRDATPTPVPEPKAKLGSLPPPVPPAAKKGPATSSPPPAPRGRATAPPAPPAPAAEPRRDHTEKAWPPAPVAAKETAVPATPVPPPAAPLSASVPPPPPVPRPSPDRTQELQETDLAEIAKVPSRDATQELGDADLEAASVEANAWAPGPSVDDEIDPYFIGLKRRSLLPDNVTERISKVGHDLRDGFRVMGRDVRSTIAPERRDEARRELTKMSHTALRGVVRGLRRAADRLATYLPEEG